MSKVIRAFEPKSFIIGVLSAVIVCMAMGAGSNEKKKSNTYKIKIVEKDIPAGYDVVGVDDETLVCLKTSR